MGRQTYTLLDNNTNLLSLGVTGVAAPNVAYFDGAAPSTAWSDQSQGEDELLHGLAGATDAGNTPAP